jgi:multidrug resistance efflux pump
VRSTAEAEATAKSALDSGVATAAQSVRTANEAAETARLTLSNTLAAGAAEVQPTRTGEMAEATSAVSQAEANVVTDEKKLEETVLRAPSAGRSRT